MTSFALPLSPKPPKVLHVAMNDMRTCCVKKCLSVARGNKRSRMSHFLKKPTKPQAWCILIDHAKEINGSLFSVELSSSSNTVADLKDGVKEKKRPQLDNLPADYLIVWRLKLTIDQIEELPELIKTADFSKDARLHPFQTVPAQKPDSKATSSEILVVQVPGTILSTILFTFFFGKPEL